MNEQVRADEAARALEEIQHRQEQVINVAMVPTWYWWFIAVLMVGMRRLRRIMLNNRSVSRVGVR